MQKEYPLTNLVGDYIGKFCFFSWKIYRILKTPLKYTAITLIAILLLKNISPIYQISQIVNSAINTAKANN